MDVKLFCIVMCYYSSSLSRTMDLISILEMIDTDDQFATMRKIFEKCMQNCKKVYAAIPEYAPVDKKLKAFRGRYGFRQYTPSKSSKYRIKIFILVRFTCFTLATRKSMWELSHTVLTNLATVLQMLQKD